MSKRKRKTVNIEFKKIGDLVPYENNPRNNKDAVEFVKNSITEFGFKAPVIINSEGVIIAGHTRLKAAKELGIEDIPCIVADDLTEEEQNAFRLADNKVSEFSTWDNEKLKQEIEQIEFDMSGFGFTNQEVAKDLENDGFMYNEAEKDFFTITLNFSKAQLESVQNYINENGKGKLVEFIVEVCEKGEDNA